MKKTKTKRTKGNSSSSIKDRIEDFLYSDTASATATKILLAFLAVGTVAIGGTIVPGLLKAIKQFGAKGKNEFSKKQINNSFSNLKRRKFVKILKNKDGSVSIKLTNKGKNRLKKYSFDNLKINKPTIWDGKWRILIFDIPANSASYEQARSAFRQKIKKLGFYQLQKSVWILPYECEDEILCVAEFFRVERFVEFITADRVMHNDELKDKFCL